MNKFKVGDVVFVSNQRFREDESNAVLKTGDIATCINANDFCYYFSFDRRSDDGPRKMPWTKHSAHEDLTKYNKRNWCLVFLGFMNIHEDNKLKEENGKQ